MVKPSIAILGAGPAGLGAAYQLASRGLARVTVLEQESRIGGHAGSFELCGFRVDYGSHRLHPSCDSRILEDIRSLLGNDLLVRPRHGRIRLRDRWIHFPLKPLDLALRLPPSFAVGVAVDLVGKGLRQRREPSNTRETTFASILEAGLGRTICRDFYFPYARKLWGLAPEALSATQARRRVSASSLDKLMRKVLSAVPGLEPRDSGRFFYPRNGYGQICEAFCRAAREAGADICPNARVESVERMGNSGHTVHYVQNGQARSLHVDYVWSTIPIAALPRLLMPSPPAECLQAAESIDYRGMVLVYLVLEQDRFSEYDAHYFPEADIPISRLSEPKNYSSGQGPQNSTVLCAELPCSPDGPEWTASDPELGQLVCDGLKATGLPVRAPVRKIATRRLRQAYPIYRQGYEAYFDQLDRYLSEVDGLLTFGRQGLFAHDNTHHALHMGYCAAACLDEQGHFDREQWGAFRRIFETHVVED